MFLSNLKSEVLLPSWAKNETISTVLCGIFDGLVADLGLRMNSLPMEASPSGLNYLQSHELMELAKDLFLPFIYTDYSNEEKMQLIVENSNIRTKLGTKGVLLYLIENVYRAGGVEIYEHRKENEYEDAVLNHMYSILIHYAERFTALENRRARAAIRYASRASSIMHQFTYYAYTTSNVVASSKVRVSTTAIINIEE